jgi:DNA-binding transcriptional ArsR family regulator
MIKKTKELFLHPVKKEIIQNLQNSEGAFYGDIVMDLKYPKYTVLKHLMELKENGYVYKDDDGGKFYVLKNNN